jgi:hypothetical protein
VSIDVEDGDLTRPRRSEAIFQLSLTEIAFTLTFILMLLLGYLVWKETRERKAAEEKAKAAELAGRVGRNLDEARTDLKQALQGTPIHDRDALISRLIDRAKAQAEADQMKQALDDMKAELTALKLASTPGGAGAGLGPGKGKPEFDANAAAVRDGARAGFEQARTAAAAQSPAPSASSSPASSSPASSASQPLPERAKAAGVKQTASSATSAPPAQAAARSSTASQPARATDAATATAAASAPRQPAPAGESQSPVSPTDVRRATAVGEGFRIAYEKWFRQPLKPGEEQRAIDGIVQAAAAISGISGSPGQFDPTKMAREIKEFDGKVAWMKKELAKGGWGPPPCWTDAAGKVQFLFAVNLRSDAIDVAPAWPETRAADAAALPGLNEALAGPHRHEVFRERAAPLLAWSNAQPVPCRHYVLIRSSIDQAALSDRTRLMVEDFFYKVEVRR